ncbi:MAG: hypothetical protein U0931_08385 [Vulcanimicrobiota bacterium]
MQTTKASPTLAQQTVAKFAQNAAHKALGPKVSAAVLKDVQGHDYKKLAADLKKLSPQQRLDALADLRQKHNGDAYSDMLNDMRDGKIGDEDLKIAIGIDRVKVTAWAATEEGSMVVKQLEDRYAAHKIKVDSKDHLGGMGSTPEVDVQKGKNGEGTDSTINIARELFTSPDAEAAILAHEGVHSLHSATGTRQGAVSEEVSGNKAMVTVWQQLETEQTHRYQGTAEERSIDETASYNTGDAEFRKHIKELYGK